MKNLSLIAMLLVVIGGLNWGLVGLLQVDLVALIFGEGSVLTNLVYILVGLSAVYMAVTALSKQKN